ncbi:hypothetical protein EIP86_008198 [Pleurotus ostreatoroseus]|nr:hypothetical protein EIP86_008198 [Pleurotus ostreatoroseus]
MAPLPTTLTLLSRSRTLTPPPDFAGAAAQWIDPTDVLTVLMIIGGDIVQRALASLAGSRSVVPFAPIAFSFGWVAYSFSAILSAIGSRRLLPDPDYDCTLVNAKSGHQRPVKSLPLARLFRDHQPLNEESRGLAVSFFETDPSRVTGYSDIDWVYLLSIVIIIVQLVLSVIPIITHRHYMVFILTLGGTVLALLTSALPQWREEKWAARTTLSKAHNVMCITGGNGSGAVMVIIQRGIGLNLEDLAAGRDRPSVLTSTTTIVLAILWIMHLVTMQGLTMDSWFSLSIGALGMIQNAVAAGAKRSPGALGFHIKSIGKTIHKNKVFEALQEAEKTESYVGLSLLPIFFPGKLRSEEIAWRDERMACLEKSSKVPDASISNEMQAQEKMSSASGTMVHPSCGHSTPDMEDVADHSADVAVPPPKCVG